MTKSQSQTATTGSRGVLVTGASRGVGAATAYAFAARGDRVLVHFHRNEQAATEVLAGLPGDGHGLFAADLADPDQAPALTDAAVRVLGRIDVLVNNAAMIVAPEPGSGGSRRGTHELETTSYQDWTRIWQQTVATNLLGPANLTWCVARQMIEVPPAAGVPVGRIVNTGSRGAYRGEPDIPAYGAAKAGLHAFGQSMAQRLAPHGIAVTTVAPGFIDTEMAGYALDDDRAAGTRAQSPFNRIATTEEIAAAIVMLAEPQLEWASGAVLDLNGASHLR
ncbi:3-oxoacyl-ACP reductase [Enemella dayhoffiae]|uniref:3-oxoacyl-ACP reductase n=1 Tax=Enemella dayhoffiae TaxID=2016507 RepID=A0A255GR79_9ACTN|nr:SDR family oxidoreductase [Enemella dayhoffiae]OYO18325.1 3-oxoacyl-ACP reductase [Enemella dayhoffiae]